MKIKLNLTAILATFVILYCNAGMMGFLKGSTIVTLLAYGSVLLWFFLVCANDKKYIVKYLSICIPVLLFLLVLEICSFFVDNSIVYVIRQMNENILFVLVFIGLFLYYSAEKRTKSRRRIIFIWCIDTIMAAIYTNYRLLENPMLSRILATGDSEAYLEETVSTAGVMGYGNIYGLVLFVVALIGIRNKISNFQKMVIFCCGVLFTYTILQAQFFIALMLVIVGVIINIIVGETYNKKKYVMLFIFLPFAILIGHLGIEIILPKLIDSDILPEMISKRLAMINSGRYLNEFFSSSRGIVYLQSINAIKSSFGMGVIFTGDTTGGHSEILDLLANYGVLLAVVFIYGIWRIKKHIDISIPISLRSSYNIVWLVYVMIGAVNTALWCPTTLVLLLIIPLMYIEIKMT